jgi:hypothetical protein
MGDLFTGIIVDFSEVLLEVEKAILAHGLRAAEKMLLVLFLTVIFAK